MTTSPSKIREMAGKKVIRNRKHLDWVMDHLCSVKGCYAMQNIVAAHVRHETDGGTALKPGDNWALSLCWEHHQEQHQIGEPAFEKKYNLDMKAMARKFWNASPWREQ